MKKNLAILAVVLVFVLTVFGTSTAWQGRMAGMGDPYGLIHDESDMLIHPAMIMNSSGFRFYTHYRFTYTDVMDWDYQYDFNFAGVEWDYDFDASGDEFKHEALIGTTFGLGKGRMGVFFTYDNIKGDYDGDMDQGGVAVLPDGQDFDLDADKQDFTLSLLYGFPVKCTDIGIEAGFAYHDEENKIRQESLGFEVTNNLYPNNFFPPLFNWYTTIYPYMIPYDSDYYEGFMKASIASELGCAADFAFTMHGGYIFSGDNEINSRGDFLPGTSNHADLDGDVDGWSLGGDLWLRYKIDDAMTLPFLISATYKKIERDGDDDSPSSAFPFDMDYEHTEKSFNLKAGGGVEYSLDKSSKIASGMYYEYIKNHNDFMFNMDFPGATFKVDTGDVPDYTEHRISLKLAYEKEISSTFGFRAGLDGFFGKTDWDYDSTFTFGVADYRDDISLDGDIWGLGLALGGTINVNPITIEPFIGFAYQRLHLDGDGQTSNPGVNFDVNGDYEKDQWLLTAGTSILF